MRHSLYCCSFSVYSESELCRCFLEGQGRGRPETKSHGLSNRAECTGEGPVPVGSHSHLWVSGQGFRAQSLRVGEQDKRMTRDGLGQVFLGENLSPGRLWLWSGGRWWSFCVAGGL